MNAVRLVRVAVVVMVAMLGGGVFGQTVPGSQPTTGMGPGRGGRGRGMAMGSLPISAPGRDVYWGTWPTADPKVVGTRQVLNLLSRPGPRGAVAYPESCSGYGALRFAQEIKDKDLADRIVARYAAITTPQGRGLVPTPNHVDRSVFGIVPLEIYRYNKGKAYLEIGRNSADMQWAKPEGRAATADEAALLAAGLTYQTRYWVDDMFMIIALQTQAYRATGEKVYLDRAATEMVSYLDKLQKPNGLFFHALDTPFYWGRGNGWFAAGMAELLSELPADHPQRARIMEGYQKMMAGLLKNQGADGMWHQLIDKPESWAETSSTGMFTFAMAVGVRKGWLAEAEYKPAAKKAWVALCGYLDESANVREVCAGTNTAAQSLPGADEAAMLQYYIDRPRNVGDLHGQAGALWAAWAMERQ